MNQYTRARVIGIVEWLCPVCEGFNKTRLGPGAWILRCLSCRRMYAHSSGLLTIPTGTRQTPPDIFIPEFMRRNLDVIEQALPLARVGTWKSGHRVNVFADLECPASEANAQFIINTDI